MAAVLAPLFLDGNLLGQAVQRPNRAWPLAGGRPCRQSCLPPGTGISIGRSRRRPWILLVSKKWWDQLSKDEQNILSDPAAASRDFERNGLREVRERRYGEHRSTTWPDWAIWRAYAGNVRNTGPMTGRS
jgi:hypothetical protein